MPPLFTTLALAQQSSHAKAVSSPKQQQQQQQQQQLHKHHSTTHRPAHASAPQIRLPTPPAITAFHNPYRAPPPATAPAKRLAASTRSLLFRPGVGLGLLQAAAAASSIKHRPSTQETAAVAALRRQTISKSASHIYTMPQTREEVERRPPDYCSTLSEDNLKRHTMTAAALPGNSLVERVIAWRKCITEDDDNLPISHRSTRSPPRRSASSTDNVLQQSLPHLSAETRTKIPPTSATVAASRGRLLCCLKVEIRSGVYRMLPVHENDLPAELSGEFCRANGLVGSTDNLASHIMSSMVTFGGGAGQRVSGAGNLGIRS